MSVVSLYPSESSADNRGMVAKTDVSNRKRQPKGAPASAGGEFARNEHEEASSALAPEKPRRERVSSDSLSAHELFSQARRANDVYGGRLNLSKWDIEDAQSAGIEEMLATAARKLHRDEITEREATFLEENGRKPNVDERFDILSQIIREHDDGDREGILGQGAKIDGALVNHVARRQAGKHINGGKGILIGEEAMAYTAFVKDVNTIEAGLGREMTSAEKDNLAEDIRQNWIRPKNKPAKNFHILNSESSIDALPGSFSEGDEYVHPAIIDPYTPEAVLDRMQSERAEALLGTVERELADDSVKTRKALRERMWDVLSSATEAPAVQAVIPEATQKIITSRISANGGVSAVLDRFDNGETSEVTEALFLPFRKTKLGDEGQTMYANISEREKEDIADLLRRHRDHANELWASAVASAKDLTSQ